MLTLILCSMLYSTSAPDFHDYAAPHYKGKAKLDLASHQKARRYRTVLREAVKSGVNFAGHYIIATWGCGTGCLEVAIVDARTGQVRFPDDIAPIAFPWFADRDDIMNRYEFSYRATSRLLVITGVPAGRKDTGTYYFDFVNGEFVPLSHRKIVEASRRGPQPRPNSALPLASM